MSLIGSKYTHLSTKTEKIDGEREFSHFYVVNEQLNSVLKWWDNFCLFCTESNSNQNKYIFTGFRSPCKSSEKAGGSYWFMGWKKDPYPSLFRMETHQSVIDHRLRTTSQPWYAMLAHRWSLFTAHGKYVEGKTLLGLSTGQGAVLLNRFCLPLSVCQLTSNYENAFNVFLH